MGGYAPLAVATPDSGGTVGLNWVHGNHLGVPIVTTDASGNAATTPNDYLAPGFPGQSRVIADLYYNRYRDYDPSTGRYIQADPIGLGGGPNNYAYAENNPIRYTDPLGLSTAGNVGGAVGGVLGGAITRSLSGARWGGMAGRAAGELINKLCLGGDDDPCTIQKQKDDFECDQWNVAWQGTGYSRQEGYRICLNTAVQREAECRARGINPNRITTPLFLPTNRRGIPDRNVPLKKRKR